MPHATDSNKHAPLGINEQRHQTSLLGHPVRRNHRATSKSRVAAQTRPNATERTMHRISCYALMHHRSWPKQAATPHGALGVFCPATSAVDSDTAITRMDRCMHLGDSITSGVTSRNAVDESRSCRSKADLRLRPLLYQDHISERGHLRSRNGFAKEPPSKACTFRRAAWNHHSAHQGTYFPPSSHGLSPRLPSDHQDLDAVHNLLEMPYRGKLDHLK